MKVRYEGFSNAEETTLAADFARMVALVPKTLSGAAPLADWFGAADRPQLTGRLRKMASVIDAGDRTISLVNRAGGVLKVEYKSLYQSHLLPVGSPGESLNGVLAYAFPVDRRYAEGAPIATLGTMSHVGSGMRIYLCADYFGQDDIGRATTIYHEITHKVLATEDFGYEEAFCQSLLATPDKAMRNADNYAMLMKYCP